MNYVRKHHTTGSATFIITTAFPNDLEPVSVVLDHISSSWVVGTMWAIDRVNVMRCPVMSQDISDSSVSGHL
jgi:hypothetical protein